jgi:hypothetical protein
MIITLFLSEPYALVVFLISYPRCSPDAEQAMLNPAPITYSTLHANQLDQIHDLLERSFWTGIDGTFCH